MAKQELCRNSLFLKTKQALMAQYKGNMSKLSVSGSGYIHACFLNSITEVVGHGLLISYPSAN